MSQPDPDRVPKQGGDEERNEGLMTEAELSLWPMEPQPGWEPSS